MNLFLIDLCHAQHLCCPYKRSIALKKLKPILCLKDFEFISLQKDFGREQINSNKLEKFISNANQMVILEIGCGINPHSLRMENGKMLSGEWKMPKLKKDTPYIRINPMEEKTPPNQVHIPLGATKGVISIF